MIKYAKILENGALEYAPRNKDGISNWGLNEELVLSTGYLPVELYDRPDDGKLYKEEFEQLSNKIIQRWIEVIPTEEEIKQARISELKQNLADADYWGQKYLDGEYTEEEWEVKKATRKAWRKELRELEGE